jgi:hypothetical protein
MIRHLLSLALTLAPSAAFAAAEGNWPESMRGGTFAKPAWILVVPVARQADGTLALFDRKNPWVREWIVPQPTASGIRTVAIVGDSEDKRLISAPEIDEMRSIALGKRARKYNAPAIAVVVSDTDGTSAVAAWMNGRTPTWDTPSDGQGKAALVTALDAIFTGTDRTVGAGEQGTASSRPAALIIAERMNRDLNQMEYRISPQSREAEQLIAGSQSLLYLGQAGDDGSVMEVRIRDGRSIEAILAEVGVALQ